MDAAVAVVAGRVVVGGAEGSALGAGFELAGGDFDGSGGVGEVAGEAVEGFILHLAASQSEIGSDLGFTDGTGDLGRAGDGGG